MELELQKYLRTNGNSIQSLESEFFIKARQSEMFPELFLFKYSQIDSPMGEKIVQESRGIILNGDDNWSIVARPYNKFFNYGEGHAKDLVWSTARVYEKLDGSLMTLYWYKGQWRVSSSGNPDAAGEVWNTSGHLITFNQLFWDTFNLKGYMLPSSRYKRTSFMFELMTPLNKVVVQHSDYRLVLHGARSLDIEGEYMPSYVVESMGSNWEVCNFYPFNNIDNVLSNVQELDPIKQEGYIVVDAYFNRVKVKSPQYVALHHMRDSLSPRRMLEIVRSNEGSEFLTYFPEFQGLYDNILLKYNKLVWHVSSNIASLVRNKQSVTRKEIGLATKGKFWQGICFPIIFNEKSLGDCLRDMPIKKLESWISKV